MHFLVSNDDGIHAEGLRTLAAALASVGGVHIVAPDRDRSAASHSLTVDRPLRMQKTDDGAFTVNGTPTDCVHLAITGKLLQQIPTMVISGINEGANLGDDVLYSGTVAAAMEGRLLGCPAIAFSLASEAGEPLKHYATAAEFAKRLVVRLGGIDLSSAEMILNVNVPDLPFSELKGVEITRLGFRHRSESVIKDTDPKGQEIFWIGRPGPAQDNGPGTDFYAIQRRCVSITPLHIDLTRYTAMEAFKNWSEELL